MLRRPQFSLRTLLLLPLAVAIFFGGMATQRKLLEKEREQLDALMAEGQVYRAKQIELLEALRADKEHNQETLVRLKKWPPQPQSYRPVTAGMRAHTERFQPRLMEQPKR